MGAQFQCLFLQISQKHEKVSKKTEKDGSIVGNFHKNRVFDQNTIVFRSKPRSVPPPDTAV
jgi:hypothetical protein